MQIYFWWIFTKISFFLKNKMVLKCSWPIARNTGWLFFISRIQQLFEGVIVRRLEVMRKRIAVNIVVMKQRESMQWCNNQYLNYMFTPEAFLSNLQLINTSRPFMMKLNYRLRNWLKENAKPHEIVTCINRLLFIALKSICYIDASIYTICNFQKVLMKFFNAKKQQFSIIENIFPI